MNKIGSVFLSKFGGFDPPFLFGLTKRQLVMRVGMVLGIGICVLFWYLKLPNILTYLLMAVILPPTFLYGSGREKVYLERWKFRYTVQERSYQTEHNTKEVFTKHDFLAKKGDTEADGS
ncbi:PrgI family mobile element protein [Streptococcus dentiloxodontae]